MIASGATAVGVFIAAWQFWQSRRISQASFEDSYDQQYRNLMLKIPVDAFLKETLDEGDKKQARRFIFNYLDLCNEQIYQRSKRKIKNARWEEWQQGIDANLKNNLFISVWKEVKASKSYELTYLGQYIDKGQTDPATWNEYLP